MKRFHTSLLLSAFVILAAITACVLPGQAIRPTPITNPSSVETALASTAKALAQQTETAQGFTATPSVVPTATFTPTPKISSVGTSLEELPDGSTQFMDYTAGMRMTFPPGWLVIRVGQEEYYAAWGREEAVNPNFQQVFIGLQDLDPLAYRADALDLRPENVSTSEISRLQVVLLQGGNATLEELRKNEVENHLPLTGYKLLASNHFEFSQGIQAVNVEIQWEYGESQIAYRKSVFFTAPGGNMVIAFLPVVDQKEILMPEFEQILSSITFLTP